MWLCDITGVYLPTNWHFISRYAILLALTLGDLCLKGQFITRRTTIHTFLCIHVHGVISSMYGNPNSPYEGTYMVE